MVGTAACASGAAAVEGWARVENAACARRLAAMADLLQSRLSAVDAAQREQWCLDNWDFVSAEAGAAMHVSLGTASHQLLVAKALRERLPRVAEVFAAGEVSYRLVNAVVYRTGLIKEAEAMAKVDTELAAHLREWGALSVAKVEKQIDYWVDRFDPYALRRIEIAARSRRITVDVTDGTGTGSVWGLLHAHHAVTLDRRLDAMARAVCDDDPRDHEQRRADALGALADGADRLMCQCGATCCAAEAIAPSSVVIHVIAEEPSLAETAAGALDGQEPPRPEAGKPIRQVTLAEAFWQPAPKGPTATAPGAVLGGPLLPAPTLTKLALTAVIRRIVHPGDTAPQPRHTPSRTLADFVRCRDMTCRFPGCDRPADSSDIDHTIPWPIGPTQASNLKCVCRRHHLLKTFWGWRDRQLPDGTVVWTSPSGRSYPTLPGSRALFPALSRPTGPVADGVAEHAEKAAARSTLMMPRRRQTRAKDRAQRVDADRKRNAEHAERRGAAPPF
jgi:hypothetical protein